MLSTPLNVVRYDTFQKWGCRHAMQVELEKEDMYMPQAEAFVNAVQTRDSSGIRSTYDDAVKSYNVSQWISAAASADRA